MRVVQETQTEVIKPTDLIKVEELDATALFAKTEAVQPLLDKIAEAVKRHVPDVETDAGRKAIASLARKVASSKVILDDLGKDHVAALKTRTKAVDVVRKHIRDTLDKLRDDTRQPLTEYEAQIEAQAEAERLAAEIEVAWDEAHAEEDLREREKVVREKEAEIARVQAEIDAKAAAEKARAEAEQAEKDRIAREARIAEEAAARAQAVAKAEAERKEQARLDAEEAKRKAEELRASNARHRARIEREVIESLVDSGCIAELGQQAADAVLAGKKELPLAELADSLMAYLKLGSITHVTINY